MNLHEYAQKIGDKTDCFIGHPFTVAGFIISLPIGFLMFGVDITNIYISIVTALILFVTAGTARTDEIALHKKLDEILKATTERHDLVEAEKKTEEEIRKL